jgi:hypothetical protein
MSTGFDRIRASIKETGSLTRSHTMSNRLTRSLLGCSIAAVVMLTGCGRAPIGSTDGPESRVTVRLDEKVRQEPAGGRLFLLIHTSEEPSPREVAGMLFAATAENPKWGRYAPLFGTDVDELHPGGSMVAGNRDFQGYPFNDFSEVPAGDYFAQAVFHLYTEVTRADGHTIEVPMDQWEGQQFHTSPGNLYSEVKKLRIDPARGFDVELTLSEVIPAIEVPSDTGFITSREIRKFSRCFSQL